MSSQTDMDRVWKTVTNQDALNINAAWAGEPGTLVKAYGMSGPAPTYMVVQSPTCTNANDRFLSGWNLTDTGYLQQTAAGVGGDAGPLCVTGQEWAEAAYVGCPPTTRAGGVSQCGLVVIACPTGNPNPKKPSKAAGWLHNATGLIQKGERITVSPGCAVNETKNAHCNRKSATVAMQKFGPTADPSSTFTLSQGKLQSGAGVCLTLQATPAVQLWSKPLPHGKAAVLFINTAEIDQTLEVPLADVPKLDCSDGARARSGGVRVYTAGSSCTVRNVWTQEDDGTVADHLHVSLAPKQSAYYVLSNPSL